MAKILKMPLDITDRAAATTAPQDVLAEDAATFDVLRRMREDILCCVLKPDQRLRFGELRQRYGTSVGTLREALSHLVSEGLARTEAGRGFTVAPISLADFLDLSELRVWLETTTLAPCAVWVTALRTVSTAVEPTLPAAFKAPSVAAAAASSALTPISLAECIAPSTKPVEACSSLPPTVAV